MICILRHWEVQRYNLAWPDHALPEKVSFVSVTLDERGDTTNVEFFDAEGNEVTGIVYDDATLASFAHDWGDAISH